MGLFDERIAYKPFEYPEYYTEGWLKQAQAFWLHTEISMQSDIKDWKEKLNEKEKNLVGNILLVFAQTECAVSDYWTQKVGHGAFCLSKQNAPCPTIGLKKLLNGFLNTRSSKWR